MTMYAEYFGLRAAPFCATPDPRLFYSNAVYREAYATLLYGVLERKGFIVLTGEVGTGKTTLLRRLMDQLRGTVRFVFFYNTTLTFDETVEFICAELELPVERLSRIQKLQRLNDFLIAEATKDGRVVLLIDEAQNLGGEILENLRLISNLETSTEKLLQIVLVGQPELDAKLADPSLRQLTQRIAVRHRLVPLRDDEIEAFIHHRLRQCGRPRQDLFTADAIDRLAVYTKGIPRLINILCDGALLLAFGSTRNRVTGAMIDEVASDLSLPREDETGRTTARAAAGRGEGARRKTGALRGVAAGLAVLAVATAAAALLPGSPLTAALGDVPRARDGGAADGVAIHPATAPAALPAAPPPAAAGLVEAAAARDGLDGEEPRRPALPSRSPSARVELPPGPRDTASDARGDGWRKVVPPGTSISEMMSDEYGPHSLLALDLIKDLNPHIADLDRVLAGERVWMPLLTVNTLAQRQPDGSYQLIVASLMTSEQADRLADRMRDAGYNARVSARDITSDLQVYRVAVEGLDSLDAARRTWQTAQTLGWARTFQGSRR